MKNNPNSQNETLTPCQIAAGYCDEEYNDVFFSSVAEAVEYIEQHNSGDDHTEKELNGVLMFGLGIYAYADRVAVRALPSRCENAEKGASGWIPGMREAGAVMGREAGRRGGKVPVAAPRAPASRRPCVA